MTDFDCNDLWSDFLTAWPPERVRPMTLEEYTNPSKDDAFIYWIESRLDKLGSIWGGSAFLEAIVREGLDSTRAVGRCGVAA